MNTRFLPLAGLLSLAALITPLQQAGAAVAYTNSLKDAAKVLSDFTDYSTINSDYIDTLTGAWFLVDSNNGLTLLSTAPNYMDGVGVYNRVLTASNDWTITVQPHLSLFSNSQTNPFYTVGINLVKISADGLEYPNRVELNLCRSGTNGSALKNFINSSLYVSNGETDTITNRNVQEAYLQFRYAAASKTVSTFYSTNGSNYAPIQSYNLAKTWGIKASDGFTLGLIANDQPEGRVIPNYTVAPGQMFLKNLIITSPTASASNSQGGGVQVQGGTISLGGLVMVNGANTGAFNTYVGNTSLTSLGSGSLTVVTNAYTNVGGLLVFNTNLLSFTNSNGGGTNGAGSNSSNTNVLGGVTNVGTNSISNTNFIGGGTLNTNVPVGVTGNGTLTLTNGTGSLTNIGSVLSATNGIGGVPPGGLQGGGTLIFH